MIRRISLIFISLFLISCVNSELEKENIALKHKIAQLEKKIYELSKTPEQSYQIIVAKKSAANRIPNKENFQAAHEIANEFVEKYPFHKLNIEAKKLLREIEIEWVASAQAIYDDAELFYIKHLYSKAKERYQEAIELKPDFEKAKRRISDCENEMSKPVIDILDISTKVTEKNNVWWRFAWKLTLKNNQDKNASVDATIKFFDKENFIIDTDDEYGIYIGSWSVKTITGNTLVRVPGASNVTKTGVSIEW